MSQELEKTSARPRLPWGIWASLVAAFAIFTLTTAVIYYRFMTTPQTNCSVVVTGNPSLDGYSVIVERMTQDQSKKRTYKDTLNKGNQYNARFFLSSGTYRVEVWDKRPEKVVAESDFISPGTRLTLDLNRKYPASRPTPAQVGPTTR